MSAAARRARGVPPQKNLPPRSPQQPTRRKNFRAPDRFPPSAHARNLGMNLHFHRYTLELKHAFTIATNSRTTTPAMLVEVERDGIVGHGEAAMPPYLGENQETAAAFFARATGLLAAVSDPFQLEEILPAV